MKTSFVKFINKYKFCIVLNFIMLIGMLLSNFFGDLYTVNTGLWSYNLHSVYVIVALPIYSMIYGLLSYIFHRRIWVPQLLLFIFTILCFAFTELPPIEGNGFLIGIFVITPCYVICSISGAIVTFVIFKMITSVKRTRSSVCANPDQSPE